MGILVVKYEGKLSRLLLSSSNIIGRHWRCDLSISKKDVPLYWLEVRWFGDFWAWRAFSCENTRGTGAVLQNGWRKWNSGKVSLGANLSIELMDESGPILCFEHLLKKNRKTLLDMDGRVNFIRGVVYLEEEAEQYHDGSLICIEKEWYRVHIPKNWMMSVNIEVDISSDRISIDIDKSALKATLTQGKSDCVIYGEPVRLLYIYAKLKKKSPERWFSSEDIFSLWQQYGGLRSSPLERLNWERSKIKNLLVAKGVKNVDRLFLRKKEKRKWVIQLSIAAENISIID